MKGVARQFPEDLDVQVLFAEAMMNVNAWKLWSLDAPPRPGPDEIVATLKPYWRRSAAPWRQSLLHPSWRPRLIRTRRWRRPALATLMPAAGHMRHMPAHIFERVASTPRRAPPTAMASRRDLAYYALTKAARLLRHVYRPQLSVPGPFSRMEGRKGRSHRRRAQIEEAVARRRAGEHAGADWYVGELYTAMVRFGMWDDISRSLRPTKS